MRYNINMINYVIHKIYLFVRNKGVRESMFLRPSPRHQRENTRPCPLQEVVKAKWSYFVSIKISLSERGKHTKTIIIYLSQNGFRDFEIWLLKDTLGFIVFANTLKKLIRKVAKYAHEYSFLHFLFYFILLWINLYTTYLTEFWSEILPMCSCGLKH